MKARMSAWSQVCAQTSTSASVLRRDVALASRECVRTCARRSGVHTCACVRARMVACVRALAYTLEQARGKNASVKGRDAVAGSQFAHRR